jgi:hypothetical protein
MTQLPKLVQFDKWFHDTGNKWKWKFISFHSQVIAAIGTQTLLEVDIAGTTRAHPHN